MAIRERDVRGVHEVSEEPAVGELVRQFGNDAATLVRQEITLAKLELKETVAAYAQSGRKLGIALGLGLAGALAVLAAVIVGLGALLDNYWISALIVGAILIVSAGLMASAAMRQLKQHPPKPEQTMQTLAEDKQWARAELRDFKQQLKQ